MVDETREEILIRDTAADTLMSAQNLKNVLKALFSNSEILTTQIKKGSSSSANIYVPKKHQGKLVTVIIWDKT